MLHPLLRQLPERLLDRTEVLHRLGHHILHVDGQIPGMVLVQNRLRKHVVIVARLVVDRRDGHLHGDRRGFAEPDHEALLRLGRGRNGPLFVAVAASPRSEKTRKGQTTENQFFHTL